LKNVTILANLNKDVTSDDLLQIRKILDESLEEKLEEKLEKKLEEKLEEKIEKKLEEKLDKKLEDKLERKFDEKLTPLQKDIKSIKKKLSYVQKTVDILVRRTDEADVDLQLRMNRVEKVLELPPLKRHKQ
jgi:predicted Holliday junction resolvase-like endonuclease